MCCYVSGVALPGQNMLAGHQDSATVVGWLERGSDAVFGRRRSLLCTLSRGRTVLKLAADTFWTV